MNVAQVCRGVIGGAGRAGADRVQPPGIGPSTALVVLAEIGDITRFRDAQKLASWARPTPPARGSG